VQVGDHLRQTPAPAGEPKIVHREAWYHWYANLIPAKAGEAASEWKRDKNPRGKKMAALQKLFWSGLDEWSNESNTVEVRIADDSIELVQAPESLTVSKGIRRFLLLRIDGAPCEFDVSLLGLDDDSQNWTARIEGKESRLHVFALRSAETCKGTVSLTLKSGLLEKTMTIPAKCEESSRVTVKISDPLDPEFPCARVAFKASDGYCYVPEPHSRVYFWGPEHWAYVNGEITFEVPSGAGELFVEKGFHYKEFTKKLRLAPGDSVSVEANLEPIVDIYKESIYPGETHLHFGPEGILKRGFSPESEMPTIASGEGLSVLQIHILQDGTNIHSNFFPTGRLTKYETSRLKFDVGEEMRNNPLGHILFFNIQTLVEPVSTGEPPQGPPPNYDFPPNSDTARMAKAQGGLVMAAHGGNSLEVPAMASQGVLDGVNCGDLDINLGAYDYYLEAGFKMPLTAGPDFELVNGPRLYAHVEGEFTYENWIKAIRKGRTFITQGPLVFLEVDGEKPGHTFEFDGARKFRVKARAVSRLPFDRLELVMNAKTIASKKADSQTISAEINETIEISESGWISARCFQPDGTPISRPTMVGGIVPDFMQRAATSPVYFKVDGKRRCSEEAKAFFQGRLKNLAQFWEGKAKFPDDQAKARIDSQMAETMTYFDKVYEGAQGGEGGKR
jgi:hypothetical protein